MDELIRDPVFVGLTRKTTLFGVQYEVCIVNAMCVSMLFIALANPLYFLIMVPVHALCYAVSLKDERIFSLLLLKLVSLSYCRNRHFWKANSYSPLEK